MQVGMVGLGRMGANMARRLIRDGHEIVGYASDPAGVKAITADGGTGTTTLADLVRAPRPPCLEWAMRPVASPSHATREPRAKRPSARGRATGWGNRYIT